MNVVKRGARFRSTNATTMNKASSRSHAILQIFVEQRWVDVPSDEQNVDIANGK